MRYIETDIEIEKQRHRCRQIHILIETVTDKEIERDKWTMRDRKNQADIIIYSQSYARYSIALKTDCSRLRVIKMCRRGLKKRRTEIKQRKTKR